MHFTYITAHSPTLLSLLLPHRIFTYVTWRDAHALHLRHSSFSNPSFASPTSQDFHLRHLASRPCTSPTSQLILQPFFRFSYLTGFSLTSPGETPMKKCQCFHKLSNESRAVQKFSPNYYSKQISNFTVSRFVLCKYCYVLKFFTSLVSDSARPSCLSQVILHSVAVISKFVHSLRHIKYSVVFVMPLTQHFFKSDTLAKWHYIHFYNSFMFFITSG